MTLFRKFFPNRQQRQDTEKARQIIEHALHKSREPEGCDASAKSGANTRDRLFTLIEDIENEIGELAIIVAADGTLLHPRLIEALSKRPDGELLRLAINPCFIDEETCQDDVNKTWSATVERYQSRPNDDELISEKATVLAGFVVYNLDAGIKAGNDLRELQQNGTEITVEQRILVKMEEACCWYRMVDEFAYVHIRPHRPLFSDLFVDKLAYLLALRGAPPELICQTIVKRSEEYATYREWVSDDPDKMAGTLLWNAAERIGAPIGLERDFLFTKIFGILFLERVEKALIRELLTGKEATNSSA